MTYCHKSNTKTSTLNQMPTTIVNVQQRKKTKFPYTHISQHLYVTYYHIYKDIKTETWPYTTHQFQDDSWNAILHEGDLQRKATTTGNRWNHLPSWKLAKMLCVWRKIQHKWRAPLQLGQSFVSHKRHSFCSRIHWQQVSKPYGTNSVIQWPDLFGSS